MTRKQRPERHGFTMVELLVVMAIIAVLAALTSSAVFRAMGLQYLRNTRSTIIKLNDELLKAMLATTAQAREETIPPKILDQGGGDPQRAREIYVKYRLIQQFPQNFSQAGNPAQGMLPAVQAYLDAVGSRSASIDESAICLYLALSMNRSGSGFNPEGLSPQEVRTVPGNPHLKYFTDAWGQPITFQNGVNLMNPNEVVKPIISSPGPDPFNGQDDITTQEGLPGSLRQGQ